MPLPAKKDLNFDIDRYLDPIVPAYRLGRLPKPITHFLGHRDSPPEPIGNLLVAAWSFLGGFAGTAALSGLFMSSFITDRGGPIIVGSFGAAAILEYNAIEAPFSQPRHAIISQLLAALIGVAVTKLFALSPDYESLRWLAGALAVGSISAIMVLTKTIHPPAGATALLAVVDTPISNLGWLYIGVIAICCVIQLAVSLLINNIQRQYPQYWWTPHNAPARPAPDTENADRKDTEDAVRTHTGSAVYISPELGVVIPERFWLAAEERAVLEILEQRLRYVRPVRDAPKCPSDRSGTSLDASDLSRVSTKS